MSILVFASFFSLVLSQSCDLPLFDELDPLLTTSEAPYGAVLCKIKGVTGPLAQFNTFCATYSSEYSNTASEILFFTDYHAKDMIFFYLQCITNANGPNSLGVSFSLIKNPNKGSPTSICQITQDAVDPTDGVTLDSDGDSEIFDIPTVTSPPAFGVCRFTGVSCQLVPSCKTWDKANGGDDDNPGDDDDD